MLGKKQASSNLFCLRSVIYEKKSGVPRMDYWRAGQFNPNLDEVGINL